MASYPHAQRGPRLPPIRVHLNLDDMWKPRLGPAPSPAVSSASPRCSGIYMEPLDRAMVSSLNERRRNRSLTSGFHSISIGEQSTLVEGRDEDVTLPPLTAPLITTSPWRNCRDRVQAPEQHCRRAVGKVWVDKLTADLFVKAEAFLPDSQVTSPATRGGCEKDAAAANQQSNKQSITIHVRPRALDRGTYEITFYRDEFQAKYQNPRPPSSAGREGAHQKPPRIHKRRSSSTRSDVPIYTTREGLENLLGDLGVISICKYG